MASYTYNGRNQLEGTVIENGLFTATRAYDNAGRLTGVSNGTLDTTAYQLTADGRRDKIIRSGGIPAPSQETYTYDNARQVASASIPLTSSTRTNNYAYDAAANRTSSSGDLWSPISSYTSNAVNEYTSINGFTTPHDPNGNLLTGQVLPPGSSSLVSCVFTWNIHNELIGATNANGDTAQYQYDALGRRTKRTETIGGVPISTWFLTNGWNVELEYEFGAYARRLTWGQDLSGSLQGAGGVGGLVMFEELPPGGGAPIPSFPTYDGNANITAWVNASGTVISRQRYDAFGNIIEQTGTAPSRYGFSTKPIELVTGFLYYGYRYYDSITGRWPSRDPIAEMGGVNLYGFVGNDGVNRLDYLGLAENPFTAWETPPVTQTLFLKKNPIISNFAVDKKLHIEISIRNRKSESCKDAPNCCRDFITRFIYAVRTTTFTRTSDMEMWTRLIYYKQRAAQVNYANAAAASTTLDVAAALATPIGNAAVDQLTDLADATILASSILDLTLKGAYDTHVTDWKLEESGKLTEDKTLREGEFISLTEEEIGECGPCTNKTTFIPLEYNDWDVD